MRSLTKILLTGTLALSLGACSTTQYYWQKNGATTQDYNQDKYRCMQESTRSQYSSSPVTNLWTGQYMGQMADAGQYVNEQVFNACMQAAGYSLVTQQPVTAAAPGTITGLPQRIQGCPGRATGKAHYDAQGRFDYRECE